MPFTCAVPGCNGNYRTGPKVKVFGFPRDQQMKEKWIKAIKRKYFEPTMYSKVCELHFTESDIRRETACIDPKSGKTVTAPLIKLRLKDDAIPTLHIADQDASSAVTTKKKNCVSNNLRNRVSLRLNRADSITEEETSVPSLDEELVSTEAVPSKTTRKMEQLKKENQMSSSPLLSPAEFLAEIEKLERRASAAEEQLHKIATYCSDTVTR